MLFGSMRRIGVIALLSSGCGYPDPAGAIRDASDGKVVDAITVDVSVDALQGCVCGDSTTLVCANMAPITCPTSCLTMPDPHCEQLIPSNGVDPGEQLSAVPKNKKITITTATVMNTDTGEIKTSAGVVLRAGGTGVFANVIADIGYDNRAGMLAVFSFDELEIGAGQTLRVFGSRPVVFLVRKTVHIAGVLDGSSNQSSRTQLGPGGGLGGIGTTVASGCGPGGPGNTDGGGSTDINDSGGGGGGNLTTGGRGGKADTTYGGKAGDKCQSLTPGEPLVGGGGGGRGSKGQSATHAPGGGGGGGVQISSLTAIIVDGTIDVGGAGGTRGPGDGSSTNGLDAGGGGGGGAGGNLILEAPVVTVTGVLAANGGGGGSAGNGSTFGNNGADGTRGGSPAAGGAALSGGGTKGGNGGTSMSTPPQAGADTTSTSQNTGGGGGAAGNIYVRAKTTNLSGGTISPPTSPLPYRAN